MGMAPNLGLQAFQTIGATSVKWDGLPQTSDTEICGSDRVLTWNHWKWQSISSVRKIGTEPGHLGWNYGTWTSAVGATSATSSVLEHQLTKVYTPICAWGSAEADRGRRSGGEPSDWTLAPELPRALASVIRGGWNDSQSDLLLKRHQGWCLGPKIGVEGSAEVWLLGLACFQLEGRS